MTEHDIEPIEVKRERGAGTVLTQTPKKARIASVALSPDLSGLDMFLQLRDYTGASVLYKIIGRGVDGSLTLWRVDE